MKVVLAIDDSSFSRAAIDLVRKMTWPKESVIVVLSVARSLSSLWADAFTSMVPYDEKLQVAELRRHAEFVEKVVQEISATGVKAVARVTTGDPRLEIIETAVDEKADLIVVGSHGRTGIAKLLLGSVASHVVTHAACSVIVARSR